YCLRRREAKRHVYFDSFIVEDPSRFQSFERERAFDDDVRSNLHELAALLEHFVALGRGDFCGYRTRNDFTYLGYMRFEINAAFFRDERWVGRDAIAKTEGRCLTNLVEIRRIEKELHERLLCCCVSNISETPTDLQRQAVRKNQFMPHTVNRLTISVTQVLQSNSIHSHSRKIFPPEQYLRISRAKSISSAFPRDKENQP